MIKKVGEGKLVVETETEEKEKPEKKEAKKEEVKPSFAKATEGEKENAN